jgi:hypothetical protein
MGACVCPRCKQNRSKRRLQLCNVCFLIDCLVEEHEQGAHKHKANPSCPPCRPAHKRALREAGATAYTQRVLALKPMTIALAKFLLRLDRDGLSAATAKGELGSRALIHLRDQGHVELTDRDVRVYAHSRYKALELLASNVTPDVSSRSFTDDSRRVQSSSHATCEHEATAKARAKCRAERRKTQ